MKRYIFYTFGIVVGLIFTGCAFTSAQVAREYNAQQKQLYAQYANAKAVSVQSVMEALQKIDRGGMKIELDESGRVKAIKYTERLDPEILKQALAMPAPKQYIPKSGLAELGDFFLKFGSFATPITAMWMNYKSHKVDAYARVKITEANANRDAAMYNAFTGNFQNSTTEKITTTTVNNNTSVKESEIVNNNTEKYNTTVQVQKEATVNSIKDTSTEKEIVNNTTTSTTTETNNNNNGGNQNIGQTNKIIPFGIDEVENENTSGENSNENIDNNNESDSGDDLGGDAGSNDDTGSNADEDNSDSDACLPGRPCNKPVQNP